MSKLGFSYLITPGDLNPKTSKGDSLGWHSCIMMLAPHKMGGGNVCPWASPGCIAGCLNTSGRGRYQKTQLARIARKQFYLKHRSEFKAMFMKELDAHLRKCDRLNKLPCCRLNGLSDIPWENVWPELFDKYMFVLFYDYTKSAKRCMASYALPSNYHLTFSRSETNDKEVRSVLRSHRRNVAVVFEDENYPAKFMGREVYSMDDHDLRFLDPIEGGKIGALYAKGRAKKDTSGFVVRRTK